MVYGVGPTARIVIWDVASHKVDKTLLPENNAGSYPIVAVGPNGNQVVAAYKDSLRVWDIASGKQVADIPENSDFYYTNFPIGFSADGSLFAFGSKGYLYSQDAGVAVYDTSTWKKVSSFKDQNLSDAVTLSPDGKLVVTVLEDAKNNAKILLWDAQTGKQVRTLDDQFFSIDSLAFSPDGKMLFSSGLMPPDPGNANPDSIYILASVWDTSTWQKSGNLFGLNSDMMRQQFAADGKSLFAVSLPTASDPVLMGMPDAQILAVRQTIEDFQAALAKGDYTKAATLYQPDQQTLDYFKKQGYGSDPLADLQSICKAPDSRCLPVSVLSIARGSAFSAAPGSDSEYSFLVRFTKPDGSTYTDSSGRSIFEMEAVENSDGTIRVTILP